MKTIFNYINLLFVLFAMTALSTTSQAANIIADGITCTLHEAIESANRDFADGNGCVDGNGKDTINLKYDLSLTGQLPVITSSINIEGNGHNIDAVGVNFPVFLIQERSLNYVYFTVNSSYITGCITGIYVSSAQSVVVNNTTISKCYSGISAMRASVVINNSTVSNNEGLGIWIGRASINLNSSTVTGNRSGGVFVSSDSSGSMTNSLITGNDMYDLHVYYNTRVVSAGYNVFGHSGKTKNEVFNIQGRFALSDNDIIAASDSENIPLASILDLELKNNGGSVPTHALPDGSPAIDIDPICSISPIEDQRGYPRPVGTGCDAGAFEAGGDARMALRMVLNRALVLLNGLDSVMFKFSKMQIPLANQLDSVVKLIDQGSYAEAIDKLQNSISNKIDGCTAAGVPDNNDWIKDCASQKQLHHLIERSVGYLEEII